MRSLIFKRRGGKADPAPSRWAYRIERWRLTPSIRLGLRVGVPFGLALAFGTWWLSDPDRQAMILDQITAARATIEERPEFMVNMISVNGAGAEVVADIHDILPIDFPVSSFDLDLEHVRETIAGLDPVKEVTVRLRPGGILDVHVTERVAVAVWRTYEQVTLVDETGAHVAEIPTRLARPELPLLAGDGADQAVGEALELIRIAAPLGDRLRGLVRMGARRWDVVLDRDQRILLPEDGALHALEHVIALDQSDAQLLSRDVVRVDMRLRQRPTVQMNPDATRAWWDKQARKAAHEAGQDKR